MQGAWRPRCLGLRWQKQFEIVNVSLVVVKVSVARGVGVLQLLRADHGRADGGVPGPVELPQVDLEATWACQQNSFWSKLPVKGLD